VVFLLILLFVVGAAGWRSSGASPAIRRSPGSAGRRGGPRNGPWRVD